MATGIAFEPERIYREYEVRELGFSEGELRRARERGELRSREVGRGRRVYLGRWLTDWLTGAEDRRAGKGGGR